MKTITMNLSAGTLVLGPALAITFRQHKEAIGKAMRGEFGPVEMLDIACIMAHACAVRVDPSITEDQVANMVDMENFAHVLAATWGISVPEVPEGEAPKAVSQSI